jgi:uncharacterized repeat protein (TIGR03806 family)
MSESLAKRAAALLASSTLSISDRSITMLPIAMLSSCAAARESALDERAQAIEELTRSSAVPTPYMVEFVGEASELLDSSGIATGFDMLLQRADAGGWRPEVLRVDPNASELVITTTAGAADGEDDAQDNALGVGLDVPNGAFRVETTLVAPPDGSGRYEQAGLWFGISQRDHIRLALLSTPDGPEVQAAFEEANEPRSTVSVPVTPSLERLRLALEIRPTEGAVRAVAGTGESVLEQEIATFTDVPARWFGQLLASATPETPKEVGFAGIFATHRLRDSSLGPLEYRFDAFSIHRQIGLPSQPAVMGSRWTTVPAFPDITFTNPTGLVEAPGIGLIFVIEREGRIFAIARGGTPDVTPREKKLVLDLSSVTQGEQDLGLLGIALHPEFGQNGSPNARFMYLHYAHTSQPSKPTVPVDRPTESRLSRFEVDLTSGVVDPASELVLIAQSDDHVWHQGGAMYFDPSDGFLYLSVGDEGDGHCRLDNCQRIDRDLYSGVLRIDVDQRGGDVSHPIVRQPESGTTAHYFIPNDNPFVGQPGVLEEFFALGLRSPHRMTHDPVEDITWIGDVGQDSLEELDVLQPGANFQWNVREGSATHLPMSEMPIGVWTDPVLELDRSESTSIIGGYVYRGSRLPELYGRYIFGDFLHGTIWALDYAHEGSRIRALDRERLLTNLLGRAGTISSFGVDLEGELYVLTMGHESELLRLERNDAVDILPSRLSQVGAFDDLASLRPITSLEPYSVQSPLWSDGAEKRRWIQVPPGQRIGFAPEGAWHFPEGTVFIKHFEFALDERTPEARRRLETRLLVAAREGRYYGVTYRWNAEGTDAEPLLASAEEELEVTLEDGSVRRQAYTYPGPNDCLVCHNAEAGHVLGVRTAQLNGSRAQGASTESPLIDWAARGRIDTQLDEAALAALPSLAPLDDDSRSLEDRVRSYWDSNCSMCHGSVTSIRATWDARYQTPLAEQRVVFGGLSGEAQLPPGSLVVAPGDPERSAIWQRALSVDPALRMPPLGRQRTDTEYVRVLERWIASL